MSKVYPYTIYHLKHDSLRELERKLHGKSPKTEKAIKLEQAVKQYINLTSNLPRIDKSIEKLYGSKLYSFEKEVEKQMEDVEKINKTKNKRKADAAKKLLDMGLYEKVAEVDAKVSEDAICMTTSINHPWYATKNKHVKALPAAQRSTETYDIVFWFDEPYLKMPLGLIDIQKGDYTNEAV